MAGNLQQAYERLFAAYGPQHWWPGESRCEILVGAVLTQNTAWRNVERALDELREAGVMDVAPLLQLHEEELAELIRPAGYYRLKARRLRNLLDMIAHHYDESLTAMCEADPETLRQQLLSVHGIGPETADAILLYVCQHPVFVVDAYAARVAARHGWIALPADYHDIQDEFHRQVPRGAQVYNEYHALLVRVGKNHCRKRQPDCDGCPLRELLPDGGPLLPED